MPQVLLSFCDQDTHDDNAAASGEQEALLSDLFSAEFIAQQQGGVNLEELMKSVMSVDPELTEHLHKLSQTADASAKSEEGMKAFTETLQDTLGSLAQNIDDAANEDPFSDATSGNEDPFSDAELLKMVSGLNFEEGAESESGFLPLMHGMMKNLLSKEVLYPSLKEISSKYPAWLSANKDKIKAKDWENYSKQYQLMSEICVVFEREQSSDSDDVKKQRHEEILDLMERMQNLGQPPKDIVEDMAPGLPFDGQGLPQMPMNPEQCSLM
ncbi:Peroxisomal biogenesis factor 19 [Lamellibrachia satsuma]|nr:Peroxisomal biogenesis factor 19 [Lamellibrachia satsuma]